MIAPAAPLPLAILDMLRHTWRGQLRREYSRDDLAAVLVQVLDRERALVRTADTTRATIDHWTRMTTGAIQAAIAEGHVGHEAAALFAEAQAARFAGYAATCARLADLTVMTTPKEAK